MKLRTRTEKKEILEKYYLCIEGWCMAYEAPDTSENVVISVEEVMEKLKEGSDLFFLKKLGGEVFLDLDDAWEEYIDDLSDYIDCENDEVIDEYIDKEMMNDD